MTGDENRFITLNKDKDESVSFGNDKSAKIIWKGTIKLGRIPRHKCWFWSLIIFMIRRFVSAVLGPHSLTGGCGGVWGGFPPPPQIFPGGSKGGSDNFCSPPC
jgi:hypothetical protein